MGDPGGRGGRSLTIDPPSRVARFTTAAETLLSAVDEAAPSRRPSRWPSLWRRAAIAIVAVAAGTGLGLLRQPGAGALNTVWAEDGGIFLNQQVHQGTWSALTTTYAGYYHLVPRLLTALAALFPAGATAAALATLAALTVAALALLVYVASADHLAGRWSRLLVSAIVVVVPTSQDDVLNSVANFHWYGLYALFWVLVWTPRGRAGRVVAFAMALLVACSDILTVVFVPLALWRAVRRRPDGTRERHGVLLTAALAAGLALQFAGLLTGASDRPLSPNPVRAATGYLVRAVPAPLVGQRWLGATVGGRWLALAAVAWLVVGAVVLVAYAARIRPAGPGRPLTGLVRPNWPLAVAAALHSAALYGLPVLLSGVATPRYAVAPAMLVVTALVALLQPAGREAAGGRVRGVVPLGVLTALLLVVAAVNLRVANPRADGPQWSTELARARAVCATGTAETVQIPIPPRQSPPWLVTLPCGWLRR